MLTEYIEEALKRAQVCFVAALTLFAIRIECP